MASTRGVLLAGGLRVACALGRSGRNHRKKEGDGSTPVGCWKLQQLRYRGDRCLPPRTGLRTHRMTAAEGWCDGPADRNYNRPVRLPYPASHEALYRDDALYDLLVVLSHNRLPRVHGLGSAIFFHLADEKFDPTAGCVAVSRRDMIRVLALCGPKTVLAIWPARPGLRKSPSPPGRGSRRS